MVDPIVGSIRRSSYEAAMHSQPSRWRRYLGALLCIGVSGLFLYLAVRNADFLEVRRALAAMDLRWLVPIIMIALVDFWLRAVRWTWMFPPDSRPTVRQAFSTFMIGTLVQQSCARAAGRRGTRRHDWPDCSGHSVPAGALATVVLEKVVDGLMLLAFLGVALLVAPVPAWLGKTGALGSLVFLGSLVLLLLVNAHAKASRNRSDATAGESALWQNSFGAAEIVATFCSWTECIE